MFGLLRIDALTRGGRPGLARVVIAAALHLPQRQAEGVPRFGEHLGERRIGGCGHAKRCCQPGRTPRVLSGGAAKLLSKR